jgi:hypothetical protein
MHVFSVSGLDPTSMVDAGAWQQVSSTAPQDVSTGNFTIARAGDLIYVFGNGYFGGGLSAAAGYTSFFQDPVSGAGVDYRIAGSAGLTDGRINNPTHNGSVDVIAVAFKPLILSPPVISSVVMTSGATTVTATWSTSPLGSTALACGTAHLGPYSLTGLEDNTPWVAGHHDILVGLTPSTTYYCVPTSANNGGSSNGAEEVIDTTALPASTPITGVRQINTVAVLPDGNFSTVFGTRYNDWYPTHYDVGDTMFNTTCANGQTLMTLDDTRGFDGPQDGSGNPTGNQSAAMMITQLSGVPMVGSNVNWLSDFGVWGGAPKSFGLVCKNDFYESDALYMTESYQFGVSANGSHSGVGLYRSLDHGITWANWTSPNTYSATGAALTAPTANWLGSINNPIINGTSIFSVLTPVNYLPGAADTNPIVDEQNAFIYYVGCGIDTASGDSWFTNGNDAALMRMPRFAMGQMSGSEMQWFTGTPTAPSWSSSSSTWQPILSVPGHVGWCSLQWLPGYNRYLFSTTTYPDGAGAHVTHSQWRWYEGPHPWGPFSEIYRADYYQEGWFGSWPLSASLSTFAQTHSLRVLTTGDYGNPYPYQTGRYSLYYADFQIEGSKITPLPLSYGTSPATVPLKGALALYDFPNAGPTLPDRTTNGLSVPLVDSDCLSPVGGYFDRSVLTCPYYTLPFGTDFLKSAGLGDFTVAVLFKYFWNQQSGYVPNNATLLAKLNVAGDSADFVVQRSGSSSDTMSVTVLGSTATSHQFTGNGWYVAMIRRDGTSGLVEIFRNGLAMADASITAPATTLNTTSMLRIGATGLTPDDSCQCMVQFVGMWNRKLATYEMQSTYSALKTSFAGNGVVLP